MKDLTDYSDNVIDKRDATAANFADKQALLAHSSGSTAYGPGSRTTAYATPHGSTPISSESRIGNQGATVDDHDALPIDDVATPRSVSDLGGNTPK